MRCRRDVFCEKEFLELCFTTGEAGIIASDDYVEYKLWRCLEKMILSFDNNLHLNVSINEIKDIANRNPFELTLFEKVLYVIFSKLQKGELLLDLSDFTIDDVLSGGNAATIYLSCQSREKCQKLMDEFGILAICPENIKDFQPYLNDYGTTVYKIENKGQEKLAEQLSLIPVFRWLTIDCNRTNNP